MLMQKVANDPTLPSPHAAYPMIGAVCMAMLASMPKKERARFLRNVTACLGAYVDNSNVVRIRSREEDPEVMRVRKEAAAMWGAIRPLMETQIPLI